MFYHLGLWAYRFRWAVILVWSIALAVGVYYGPRVGSVLQPGGFSNPNSEGSHAIRLLHDELGASLSSLTIVFSSDTLRVEDPLFQADMERVIAAVSSHPLVTAAFTAKNAANPRMIAPDGHTTFAVIGLDATIAEAQRALPQIKALVPASPLKVLVTGGPAAYADVELVSHLDLQRAEQFSFPLALGALVLVFGGVIAGAIPVLIGGSSVLVALTLIYFLAHAVEMSIFVQNITTMLGLGISIDYALLMVSRFREERSDGDIQEAIGRTMATAGKAVFYSGLTVLLGLWGLLSFNYMMLRSLGIGGALVVVLAVTGALTLAPALFGVLGGRIDALTLFKGPGTAGEGLFWRRVAALVGRHPLLVFLVVMGVLLSLGAPFLRVRMGAPDVTILPPYVESRQGFDLLRGKFGAGEIAPILVVAEASDSIFSRDNVATLYDFARALERLPGVVRVESMVTLDPMITKGQYQLLYEQPNRITDPALQRGLARLGGGRVALISVVTNLNPVAPEAQALVQYIRSQPPGAGLKIYVGGAAAELMDVVSDLYTSFPRALALIVLTTYLALTVLFRSVILPAKAILMDMLSILASYGALVVIFQDGAFHGILGFTPEGYVDATVPIVMFCVLFGLSMDYEVFMLTRIKESYDTLKDNAAAVSHGLEHTGRIVTSAALIIVIVAGSFSFADILVIKALGIGIAIAILLDATLVRGLLVPATMLLLGKWNWWSPRWLPGSLFAESRGASIKCKKEKESEQ